MQRRKWLPLGLQSRRDLQQTAGVGGNQRVGMRSENIARFTCPQLARRLRLEQIIDTCAAAADLSFWDINHLEIRYGTKNGSWLLAYALTMRQMAGVMVGNSSGNRVT